MAKEGTTAAGAARNDWFSVELYKRSQGRFARQATFGALAIIFALGAWSLHTILLGWQGTGVAFGIAAAFLVVGVWFAFRLVNMPRFADFLISVEAEMNKVSWPTRTELFRSSIVVIVTIFGLAMLLFFYDVIWRYVLMFLGVIGK
jgi:preprotein translocase subunit SecE